MKESSAADKMIEVVDLHKRFKDLHVLNGISTVITRSEVVAIMGPSGGGKSTFLRCLNRLEEPTSGHIYIEGVDIMTPYIDINKVRTEIGMVFQSFNLFPHLTAIENIKLAPTQVRGLSDREATERGMALLEKVGLTGKTHCYPEQLSGGQQQRVALARALVRDPEVFLLDEPLSNLDAQVRESTRTELKRLFKELRATVLYVTHDQTEAMMMSDLMVVIDGGAIRQIGDPPSIYRDPAHRFVAEFVGAYRINMIPGVIDQGRFVSEDSTIAFATQMKRTGKVLMGIRPEQISPEGTKEIHLKGETVLIEPTGPSSLVWVRVGKNEFKMLSHEPPSPEEPVSISFSSRDIFFFDARSGYRLRPDFPPSSGNQDVSDR